MSVSYLDDKRYVIGVIGDIPALLTFWQMFKDQTNDQVLRDIGVVAAALPGESVLPDTHDGERRIPTYAGYKAMLENHPEINMVIEATGRAQLVHELRDWLPASVTLVERGAATFFINLLATDRIWVACKADLLHTQNMLKTIVDQMDQEILFLDRDGVIVGMNKTLTDRMGRPKSSIMGHSYREVIPGIDSPEAGYDREPFASVLKKLVPAETVTRQIGEDGRVQYFRIYMFPIFDEDGVSVNHVVALRRDITQRTFTENRLQQAEKLASIVELSSYMAHEIRNPLFTISGFANSLMRTEGLDEGARDKLSIILSESRRLDEILKALMNFTRPTEAQEAEVNINAMVEATMDVMRLPCDNQGVEAIVSLDESVALVRANPDLIKQCLINLIKNALEAMPDGGKLYVTTTMHRRFVLLSVEDTGVGIPAEIRDKIFSPFFSTKGKGAGLGLAQTHKIIDEIGGEVDMASREGVGTKVSLLLPPLLKVAETVADG
ncbi:two-component system sensor histidine kinase NtrB [Pseudodesulfovibrio sp.]|uniref:two-component system sensor histidine kinase NtrB n=1 Tax=unclassified Pseudodesulfovibrio TaxID=2661612 RepID=UPI003B001156